MAKNPLLKPKTLEEKLSRGLEGGRPPQDRKYKTKGSNYVPGRRMPRIGQRAELTPDEMPAQMRRKLEEEQNV